MGISTPPEELTACSLPKPDINAARADKNSASPRRKAAPRVGAFKRRDCTPGALSMIDALLDVALRLPEGAAVVGLAASDAAGLLDWETEKYRRSLDRS